MGQNKDKKILVIDDDDLFRSFVVELLSRNDFQFDEAENGKQGLKKLHADTFDLVITDIVMPEMEGISLIRSLREHNNDIPVIAMTGNVHGRMEEFLDISKQLGASAVLKKPIASKELLDTVASLIQ